MELIIEVVGGGNGYAYISDEKGNNIASVWGIDYDTALTLTMCVDLVNANTCSPTPLQESKARLLVAQATVARETDRIASIKRREQKEREGV